MKRARGMALVTALLVVALATVATSAMALRQQVDVRRTANLLDGDQAWLYALGAEAWAIGILARDRRDNATDSLGEDWARVLPPLPVEGGQIAGAIEDMQARFNLTNLATAQGAPSGQDIAMLQRLLQALELDPALAYAMADWVDADLEPHFPDGAEDAVYLVAEPAAYRTANRPAASVSELRLVRGIDADVYERLAPHLSALPERTPINVNTAGLPVLMALAEGLDERLAQELVDARGENGFADLESFLAHSALAGLEIAAGAVSVASQYFRLHAEARVGRSRAPLTSLLHRTEQGTLRVLVRTRGAH
jgi:general secretion pathway protein K